MADPQSNATSTDHVRTEQTRGKGDGAPRADAAQGGAEPRSFEDQHRSPAGKAGEALSHAAQPVIEGGRQMAEQGRRAGQQMTEAWRGAVDPFLAIQYDMGRWFDDVVRQTFGFRNSTAPRGLFGIPSPFAASPFAAAGLFGQPAADLHETDNAYLLAVELPGLSKDDINIQIDGDALVVAGHKSEASHDASAAYRMNERRYGRFERSFPLPPDIDRTKIEARYQDGLLKITLPKSPEAATHRSRIEIKT